MDGCNCPKNDKVDFSIISGKLVHELTTDNCNGFIYQFEQSKQFKKK